MQWREGNLIFFKEIAQISDNSKFEPYEDYGTTCEIEGRILHVLLYRKRGLGDMGAALRHKASVSHLGDKPDTFHPDRNSRRWFHSFAVRALRTAHFQPS